MTSRRLLSCMEGGRLVEPKMKCICITNRHLCARPLEEQLERLLMISGEAAGQTVKPGLPQLRKNWFSEKHRNREQDDYDSRAACSVWPKNTELTAVILREKDLPEDEYYQMLCKVKSLCSRAHVPLVAHNYVDCALQAGVNAVHLPMPVLRTTPQDKLAQFSVVGASTHSVEEAREAVNLGTTYVTVSHIFPTDCKKDLPPHGLEFLSDVCASVSVPVYALGGINFENARSCLDAGAAGVCMMSGLMRL